jgi:periplasmic copper chaperone A
MKFISFAASITMGGLAVFTQKQAFAHATLETSEASANSSYKGVVRIAHGCAGSPTISIKIKIPEGMIGVKPMPKQGWALSTIKAPYAQPYQSHGKTITEGVSEITWSGGKLLDDHYDEFVFKSSISDRVQAGSTLYVPVIQTCDIGESAWVEMPVSGQDPKSLKLPAPALKIAANGNPASGNPVADTVIKIGDLTITQPWSRQSPPAAKTAGGYMSIKNQGTADRLIAVESNYASAVEIHEMSNLNNVMTMRKLEAGLEIKPNETVTFAPGGYHVMFMGVKEPAKAGASFAATLVFEKAGRVDVMFNVQALTAPTHKHEEHKH